MSLSENVTKLLNNLPLAETNNFSNIPLIFYNVSFITIQTQTRYATTYWNRNIHALLLLNPVRRAEGAQRENGGWSEGRRMNASFAQHEIRQVRVHVYPGRTHLLFQSEPVRYMEFAWLLQCYWLATTTTYFLVDTTRVWNKLRPCNRQLIAFYFALFTLIPVSSACFPIYWATECRRRYFYNLINEPTSFLHVLVLSVIKLWELRLNEKRETVILGSRRIYFSGAR